MAKEIMAKVKLQCPGGQATPAPPVGPALGQHGVNIADFVKRFNDKTRENQGMVVPVEIFIFKDRSFDFVVKSPPAAVLIKDALKLKSGANNPGRESVGTIKQDQLLKIAAIKKADLNAGSDEAAARIIAGTARSMGVDVVE
jgi:large subunit ribosomal protein L11